MKELRLLVLGLIMASLLAACGKNNGETVRGRRVYDYFSDKQVAQLAVAAAAGDVEKINSLVAKQVNVNSSGKEGITPLFWAYYAQNRAGFEMLLQKGADLMQTMDHGSTVMELVAGAKDSWFLETALKYEGDPDFVNTEMKRPIIFEAISSEGGRENVELFIQAGADLNVQNGTGNTPMMVAAVLGRYDLAYLFLKAGADYTITDNWGYTITYPIENYNLLNPKMDKWRDKVVEFLREHGVDVK